MTNRSLGNMELPHLRDGRALLDDNRRRHCQFLLADCLVDIDAAQHRAVGQVLFRAAQQRMHCTPPNVSCEEGYFPNDNFRGRRAFDRPWGVDDVIRYSLRMTPIHRWNIPAPVRILDCCHHSR